MLTADTSDFKVKNTCPFDANTGADYSMLINFNSLNIAQIPELRFNINELELTKSLI